MKEQLINFETAKLAKEVGFNLPTPHCFIHNTGEEYYIELFSFYRSNILGNLSEIYENEKKVRNFSETEFLGNEEVIYFDYNQDLRKLLSRRFHGEIGMTDEMAYNMCMDSYTYEKLSAEEEENLKLTLPNHNDGDFMFDVYQDTISLPTQSLLQKWLRETHNIHITIESYHCLGNDKPFGLGIDAMFDGVWDYVAYPGDTNFDTYEDALEIGLIEGLKLIKNETRNN